MGIDYTEPGFGRRRQTIIMKSIIFLCNANLNTARTLKKLAVLLHGYSWWRGIVGVKCHSQEQSTTQLQAGSNKFEHLEPWIKYNSHAKETTSSPRISPWRCKLTVRSGRKKLLVLPCLVIFRGTRTLYALYSRLIECWVSKRIWPLITDIRRTCTLYQSHRAVVTSREIVSLVKSQLPYATEVWSPTTANLRTILERVQRRPTPWIPRISITQLVV